MLKTMAGKSLLAPEWHCCVLGSISIKRPHLFWSGALALCFPAAPSDLWTFVSAHPGHPGQPGPVICYPCCRRWHSSGACSCCSPLQMACQPWAKMAQHEALHQLLLGRPLLSSA